MLLIRDYLIKYSSEVDFLDLELIIAHVLKKPREFVLAHPEYKIPKFKIKNLKLKISGRMRGEPLAYILGEKEFYGLKFKVNKNVLIPRPETEILVDLALNNIQQSTNNKKIIIADIGTGSGNIIISVACSMKHIACNKIKYYATDISLKALNVARQNANIYRVDKKIKFFRGNLLRPVLKMLSVASGASSVIILANLPYLSPAIYRSSQISVRIYEPKNALLAGYSGLFYYKELIRHIKRLKDMRSMFQATCFMEISPEQKKLFYNLIKKYFPGAIVKFHKDLSGRTRVCEFSI